MAAKPTPSEDAHLAKQARLAAIVIVVAALLWVGGNILGGQLGLNPRYAFLLDFAAIAAFVWALIVTWRVWNRRRGN
ncbi:MAG: DUF5337 domain-containing protein [Paracoccaceae bacterium]|nr:DUF5337 domain-containing protein [Paracoccaceae bacterium]MDE3121420.1 DUF5337 domain-containing protein [Paracoccaceae bacterium]MDE3239136.1 DUF5337 domain-containing protein [Paracoccaceae bacterium]